MSDLNYTDGFNYTDNQNEAVKQIMDLIKIHFELGIVQLKRDNEDMIHTFTHGEKSAVIAVCKDTAECIELLLDNDDMPPLED